MAALIKEVQINPSVTNTNTSATSWTTPALSAAPVTGDLVIVAFWSRGQQASVTGPAGLALVGSAFAGQVNGTLDYQTIYIWSGNGDGTTKQWTVTDSANDQAIVASVWVQGNSASGAVNQHDVAKLLSTVASPQSSNSLTPSVLNCLPIAFGYMSGSASTAPSVTTAGWTSETTHGFNYNESATIAYGPATTDTTTPINATFAYVSGSQRGSIALLLIAPAASGSVVNSSGSASLGLLAKLGAQVVAGVGAVALAASGVGNGVALNHGTASIAVTANGSQSVVSHGASTSTLASQGHQVVTSHAVVSLSLTSRGVQIVKGHASTALIPSASGHQNVSSHGSRQLAPAASGSGVTKTSGPVQSSGSAHLSAFAVGLGIPSSHGSAPVSLTASGSGVPTTPRVIVESLVLPTSLNTALQLGTRVSTAPIVFPTSISESVALATSVNTSPLVLPTSLNPVLVLKTGV